MSLDIPYLGYYRWKREVSFEPTLLISVFMIPTTALKRAQFACNPRFIVLRQEDGQKFKTDLICIANTRIIGNTQKDLL